MILQDWLRSFKPTTKEEALHALREIMQEVALAALSRASFFEKAAFYGGTALRIFYGLNRYSEDLDFSLLRKDSGFKLNTYLETIVTEFESLGLSVSVRSKEKAKSTAIDSAFLKTETYWRELVLDDIVNQNWQGEKLHVRIKLEIDIKPPPGFETEEKLLLRPFSCYVKCFVAPDLFAGKLHAVLFRKWKSRVKGRDWFDMEWYIRKGMPIRCEHLRERAIQSGDWPAGREMTKEDLRSLLIDKIEQVSFERLKEDVIRFIPDPKVLAIWSPQYFRDLVGHLKVQ